MKPVIAISWFRAICIALGESQCMSFYTLWISQLGLSYLKVEQLEGQELVKMNIYISFTFTSLLIFSSEQRMTPFLHNKIIGEKKKKGCKQLLQTVEQLLNSLKVKLAMGVWSVLSQDGSYLKYHSFLFYCLTLPRQPFGMRKKKLWWETFHVNKLQWQ